MKKCKFDKDGLCHALACYTSLECGARDEQGNPKYVEPKAIKIQFNYTEGHKNMPKGFEENYYNHKTGQLCSRHVDYTIIERDGKRFAEPIGKPRGNVEIEDDTLCIDEWWPLEDTACSKCGVYGLVHTIHIGEYSCANCGSKCILAPKTKLHIIGGGVK